jgi:Sortase domain
MATMPRHAGRHIACGLALVIAAALPTAAAAATNPPGRGIQRPSATRQLVRVRYIRKIATKKKAAPPVNNTPVNKPWTLEIPAIGVSADLMRLGGAGGQIGPGGASLPTPPLAEAATEAGWYQFTAVPGAAGNAVIVAHVDTYVGPGVFYDLYLLRHGDAVYVTDSRGRQRFDVTWISEMSKISFPVNRVFGNSTGKPTLWLITCGGPFDSRTGHYLDNIVVSAALVAPKSPKHP